MFNQVPIVAIATAPGQGGIGIIRVSGSSLSGFIQDLFSRQLIPRHAHYLPFKNGENEILDKGIVIFFPAPDSYTGEDVLELHGHGGQAVLQCVIKLCLEIGCKHHLRLAEPGEFTYRAFVNGKLDLTQAEAVADLISASSETAARAAIKSLSGQFSTKINSLSERIVYLRTLVEASLDFPEDDLFFLEKDSLGTLLRRIIRDIATLMENSCGSSMLKEGIYTVIIGQSNAGKSSLFNCLVGEDEAIVTPIAGTTRDRIIQKVCINNVALNLVDTAGIRKTEDIIENLGIDRSWEEVKRADIVIHLQDITREVHRNDVLISPYIPRNTHVLRVFSKIDLLRKPMLLEKGEIAISTRTGKGLNKLRNALSRLAKQLINLESPYLARTRHLKALQDSSSYLEKAVFYIEQEDPSIELLAEELSLAHRSLCSITGRYTNDDLLGEIFSKFCIGK